MDNEIVRFKDDAGNDVQVSGEQIKQYLCPAATDSEIMMALELCKHQRLNPFIKDVYIVKYGSSPAQIITGKEVFSKRAAANKRYKGFSAGVVFIDKQGTVQTREGSGVYKAAGEKLVGGWCRVFVDGREPIYNEVSLEEYSTGKSLWGSKPATMIRKVAYVQSLREAFPDDFQGMYDAAEMGQSDYSAEASLKAKEAVIIPAAEIDTVASDKAIAKIKAACSEFAVLRGRSTDDAIDALLKSTGLDSLENLTPDEAEYALTRVLAWVAKAHTQTAPAETVIEPDLADEDIDF